MCPIQFRRDGPPHGPPAFMNFEVFTRVIDDLPSLRELHLQGLGEPRDNLVRSDRALTLRLQGDEHAAIVLRHRRTARADIADNRSDRRIATRDLEHLLHTLGHARR